MIIPDFLEYNVGYRFSKGYVLEDCFSKLIIMQGLF